MPQRTGSSWELRHPFLSLFFQSLVRRVCFYRPEMRLHRGNLDARLGAIEMQVQTKLAEHQAVNDCGKCDFRLPHEFNTDGSCLVLCQIFGEWCRVGSRLLVPANRRCCFVRSVFARLHWLVSITRPDKFAFVFDAEKATRVIGFSISPYAYDDATTGLYVGRVRTPVVASIARMRSSISSRRL